MDAGRGALDQLDRASITAGEASGARAVSTSEAISSLKAATRVSEQQAARRASGRNFANVGGVWVEAGIPEDAEIVTVEFGSEAYFKLVEAAPALRDAFALGDRVVLKVGRYALAIDSAGISSADDAQVKALLAAM